MEDKRRFTRIFFSTPVLLEVAGEQCATSLIDISLKGALITATSKLNKYKDEDCTLRFELQGSDVEIEMKGKIVHIERNSIGIACEKIDIESVTHLRRLIELNIGNADLLDRDLDSLTHPEL